MRSLIFLFGFLACWNGTYAQLHAELNIPNEYQLQTNWCWAACAKMIDKYHSNNTSVRDQCEIVRTFLAKRNAYRPNLTQRYLENCCPNCPCTPSFDIDANIKMDYSTPFGIFTGVNYHTLLVDLGYYNTIDKEINLNGIQREILKCTPLIMGYEHEEGGEHIVLVKGYDFTSPTGEKMLKINDPLNPNCATCTLQMANFLALEDEDCIIKVSYFLSGIYRKDYDPCILCDDYITIPFAVPPVPARLTSTTRTVQGETFAEILKNLEVESFLKIPVSYINFNLASKQTFKFNKIIGVKRDTDYYYFRNDNRYVLTKQNIKNKPVVTMLKTCNYPLKYIIYRKENKDSIEIDLLKGDYKFEIIRLAGPFHFDFYKFTDRDGKSYIVPSMNNNNIIIKKESIKALKEYNQKCLLRKVNQMIGSVFDDLDFGKKTGLNVSNSK